MVHHPVYGSLHSRADSHFYSKSESMFSSKFSGTSLALLLIKAWFLLSLQVKKIGCCLPCHYGCVFGIYFSPNFISSGSVRKLQWGQQIDNSHNLHHTHDHTLKGHITLLTTFVFGRNVVLVLSKCYFLL